MQPVLHGGRLAAIATPTRVFLDPDVEGLPSGDADMRVIAFKCLYAREVMTGELPGPYTDRDAERFARDCLIDDKDFAARTHEPDACLAARYGVPLTQIAAQRKELASSSSCSKSTYSASKPAPGSKRSVAAFSVTVRTT